MAKDKAASGSAGGGAPTVKKERKPKEVLSLPLSKEVTEGVRELASGFGKSQAEVLGDLSKRADARIAAWLQELYESYERARREKLGKFLKPDNHPEGEALPVEGSIGS